MRTTERLAAVGAERERLLGLERRGQYLGEVQRWLAAHLVPAIAEIEEEVFERIRYRFEGLFADWFARFVEADNLEARVDETFSPMLRSGEYDLDLDLDSLSGEQRASRSRTGSRSTPWSARRPGWGVRACWSSDEPTDGFSSGQLNRLRDILGETGCDQTVIVSHEQTSSEGVADRVYGVSKERGVSTVAPL